LAVKFEFTVRVEGIFKFIRFAVDAFNVVTFAMLNTEFPVTFKVLDSVVAPVTSKVLDKATLPITVIWLAKAAAPETLTLLFKVVKAETVRVLKS
jgi:hypothetical protein